MPQTGQFLPREYRIIFPLLPRSIDRPIRSFPVCPSKPRCKAETVGRGRRVFSGPFHQSYLLRTTQALWFAEDAGRRVERVSRLAVSTRWREGRKSAALRPSVLSRCRSRLDLIKIAVAAKEGGLLEERADGRVLLQIAYKPHCLSLTHGLMVSQSRTSLGILFPERS